MQVGKLKKGDMLTLTVLVSSNHLGTIARIVEGIGSDIRSGKTVDVGGNNGDEWYWSILPTPRHPDKPRKTKNGKA